MCLRLHASLPRCRVASAPQVLHTLPSFDSDGISFVTYDEEHHRFGLSAGAQRLRAPEAAGGAYTSFTYDSLRDLRAVYERLRNEEGIVPFETRSGGQAGRGGQELTCLWRGRRVACA